ncbi:MAG: FitA-like ribbon-helix-helix domain-containing protein [bacterium]|jgi:hypothetical protein
MGKPTPRPTSPPRTSGKKTASLLLRGIDRDVLDVFRVRAERHGRSLQAELHASLRRDAQRNFDEALRISQHWQGKFAGRTFTDRVGTAKQLIDEDRRR